MVVGEHFGPNGQVFYEEHSPEGDDGPARFHTLVAGLSPYHSRQERRGRTYISSHTAAGSFAPAPIPPSTSLPATYCSSVAGAKLPAAVCELM